MTDLISTLRSGKVLLMDGAMGTELQRRTQSLSFGPGEGFNLTAPDLVRSIHRAYLDAGADVLLTNTFQANPAALARQQLADRQHDIWQAALRLARAEKPRFVVADIGPVERLTRDIARDLIADCRGVDAILLETWSSLDDLREFAAAGPGAPLLVSFTFHRDGGTPTTIEGVSPEDCARAAVAVGAAAIGANCGKDIRIVDMTEVATLFRSACGLPTFARPNAGTPTQSGGVWTFPHSAAAMAAALPALLDAGVAMVGGCCGTTPEHIRAFREVIDAHVRA